jgi:hypothetical protein
MKLQRESSSDEDMLAFAVAPAKTGIIISAAGIFEDSLLKRHRISHEVMAKLSNTVISKMNFIRVDSATRS